MTSDSGFHTSVPELLTIEEFAQSYRVGRSTVFEWIATRKMVQGLHYFKIGKTIRIPWSMELLASLSTVIEPEEKTPLRSGRCRDVVNLDY